MASDDVFTSTLQSKSASLGKDTKIIELLNISKIFLKFISSKFRNIFLKDTAGYFEATKECNIVTEARGGEKNIPRIKSRLF